MTMDRMTPAEAWEGFVGSQSPTEFMEVSRQKGLATIDDAVYAYVEDIPAMFNQSYTSEERAKIFAGLCRYIKENAAASLVAWQNLTLRDGDGDRASNPIPLLREFRSTGAIAGYFFDRLGLEHECEDDASTWGPASPNQIDWTDFPEE